MVAGSDTRASWPRITIAVVGKSHNTRFCLTKAGDVDRSGNLKNGTTVDRGVTDTHN
ncbi:putative RNA interference and gene silencing protein [Rosellinia necatrix]|uniref:Putative RNA interference and gene silencing protein n=1 Tax=Rosellinia necatrix TaxID=77044 RepID=A0A1S8A7U6_ROSNE|nr:putative RNA interference and gene silencing protein [Rosellinia necatrix]